MYLRLLDEYAQCQYNQTTSILSLIYSNKISDHYYDVVFT